jgi:hypothetical protein
MDRLYDMTQSDQDHAGRIGRLISKSIGAMVPATYPDGDWARLSSLTNQQVNSECKCHMAILDLVTARESEKDIRSYRIDRFILYPEHWTNYPDFIKLDWKKVKFNASNAQQVPGDKTGVYTFVADAALAQHPACSYLLYVGKAESQDLRKRYRKYLRAEQEWKERPHIVRMISNWSGHLWFYYAEIAERSAINSLEAELITALLPPMNREWPAEISPLMRMVF